MTERTRLQLTWKNKDLRLLNHGASTYEWAEPRDWRVSEVRVLQELEQVGEDSDNLLIEGDALYALTSLSAIPEYAQVYKGKVKLCYIDPPFNTGQAFAHYKDSLENSVWLTMFRDRVAQIKELLAPDGTAWVHLDDEQMHRARLVLDEVFGADNFIATVAWQKADSPRNSARWLSVDQDYIHVYAKSAETWRPNRLPRTVAADAIYRNPDNDPNGPWLSGDPYANKPYAAGQYEITGPTGRTFRPPPGRYWRVSEERLRELDEAGRVWWGPDQSARPSIKRYLSEVGELVPRTLWLHQEVGSNRTSSNEVRAIVGDQAAFATPKPERLLARMIQIGTNPDDIVLDCFLGSGTTAAVAHKMGRRWVGVELEGRTVEDFIKPRLAQVIDGTDLGGITQVEVEEPAGDLPEGVPPATAKQAASTLKALLDHGTFDALSAPRGALAKTPAGQALTTLTADSTARAQVVAELVKAVRAAAKTEKSVVRNWTSGGGYRHLVVGESMFEENSGVIVLADWATNGALAEAVAAQMRFPFRPQPPFAGKKGRQWLAVIDGMLTESLVDYLLAATEDDETIVAVAQGLMPGVGDYLRAQRKGSRARKVPRDLAHRSARTERVDTSVQNGDTEQ